MEERNRSFIQSVIFSKHFILVRVEVGLETIPGLSITWQNAYTHLHIHSHLRSILESSKMTLNLLLACFLRGGRELENPDKSNTEYKINFTDPLWI